MSKRSWVEAYQAHTRARASRHGETWTLHEVNELEAARKAGFTVPETAELLGRTYLATQTMISLLNRGDWTPGQPQIAAQSRSAGYVGWLEGQDVESNYLVG